MLAYVCQACLALHQWQAMLEVTAGQNVKDFICAVCQESTPTSFMIQADLLGPHYQCAVCENVFQFDQAHDAEARQELRDTFGDVPIEECEIVCDSCWNMIRPEQTPCH